MGVQAEEMSVEALAQPVTKFRLYQPVLDLSLIHIYLVFREIQVPMFLMMGNLTAAASGTNLSLIHI